MGATDPTEITNVLVKSDHDDPHSLAVILDPLAFFTGHEGPLKLHLAVNPSSRRIFLCLSSKNNETSLLRVRLDKLLRLKRKVTCSATDNRSDSKNSKSKKRRKRNRKRKKEKKEQIDHYDWSRHEFEVILKEFDDKDSTVITGTEDGKKKKKTKKRSRKHKRKRKRKKKDKRKSRSKDSKNKKSRRKRSKRESSKSQKIIDKKNKDESESDTTTNSGTSPSGTGTEPSAGKDSPSDDSPPDIARSPSTLSTPKRSNLHSTNNSKRSPMSDLPSFSMSDLRSPITWEKRRQAILQQSKQPGTARISAISLSNPFQTASGYFVSSGATTQAKLDETLKGGAFVYKSSRRESKMLKWQKKLTRQFQPVASLFVDNAINPPSSPSSSHSSTEPPSSPPEPDRSSYKNDPDLTYLAVDGSSWIEFNPEMAPKGGGASLFRGAFDNDRRNVDRKSVV